MGRAPESVRHPRPPPRGMRRGWILTGVVITGLVFLAAFPSLRPGPGPGSGPASGSPSASTDRFVYNTAQLDKDSPYGKFPLSGDAFRFMPCTSTIVLPPLDDGRAEQTWASQFDPNPDHWSWGPPTGQENSTAGGDPYAGRGVFMCGYLEVPLDYTNASDSRIVRLAVTKFQVSGLARLGDNTNPSAGKKSERTIVIEPGGPGGSGTSYAWRSAQNITARFTDGTFDVLGWDPRGVNASLPAVSCFPHDASRDRWSLLTQLHHAVSASPREQLEVADAMNAAVMRACWEKHGDLGRFLGTGLVARDLEQIRIALGEAELTGYLVSYGTGIGQTYASLFPDSVGRVILDGTEYVRDHRLRGGFGWTALDNGTDAWHDGFLGECVNAGPEHCALAKPKEQGKRVTLPDLVARMDALLASLADRPIPAFLPSSGPTMVTYSALVDAMYGAMYNARSWPALAQTLSELEDGNSTLAASFLETSAWWYDPEAPCSATPLPGSDSELGNLVICADSYDAPGTDDVDWWVSLWGNMTTKSWIAGNSRMYSVLPCRHFLEYWPQPVGVYRGDLNHTLKHPVLLIAETYDPATPLRNGRRLLQEMGKNARLVAHHGYGHSSRDTSKCTETIARAYILNGTLPDEAETACYADEKPYLYGVKTKGAAVAAVASVGVEDPLGAWQEHLAEMSVLGPKLL